MIPWGGVSRKILLSQKKLCNNTKNNFKTYEMWQTNENLRRMNFPRSVGESTELSALMFLDRGGDAQVSECR
jgi:hypothetical protein